MSLSAICLAPSSGASQIVGPFFNYDEASSYTDSYRGISRAGWDLEGKILEQIESAHSSIEIAIQELRLPLIAKALVRKHKAGVKVRVVLENNYNFRIADLNIEDFRRDPDDHASRRVAEYVRFVDMNGDGYFSDFEIAERDAIAILRAGEVPLIDDTADGSKGTPLMHHKFVVVDQKNMLVTSANFTMSDIHGDYTATASRGNANALMIFENPTLVSQFQREFEILWGTETPLSSRFGVRKAYRGAQRSVLDGKTIVTTQFSPTSRTLGFDASTSGLINRSLQRAQRSVHMALFVFSEQRFADTLDELRKRFPLDIRALVQGNFAFQWYSELYDMLGLQLRAPNCEYEPDNRPWAKPISTVGVPNMNDGDILHHKFAVIDEKTTIFGSQNWSGVANDGNDESLMVIEDPQVAKKFSEEFNRLYGNSRLGVPFYLDRKIAEREALCAGKSAKYSAR